MDYQTLSRDIVADVGGAENITSFTNCMPRLRVDVVDQGLVDIVAIKKPEGVLGVIPGEQLQIVVGPGHAQRLRDSFALISGVDPSAEVELDVNELADEQKAKIKSHHTTSVHAVFRHIGSIFIPIIPAFIACGLVLAIANTWKLIDPRILTNPWFLTFAGLGGIITVALNLIVGHNTAKEFGGTPVLGLLAGAVPYLVALGGIPARVAADGTAIPAQPLVVPFFGALTPQLGGIIGVLITAWIFTVIEKRVRKVVPASLDLFLVPFVTLIVGAAASILVIMPISALLMRGINWLLIDFALVQGGIIGGFLLSSFFLPLVMLGIHQGLTPIHAQLIADHGYTELLPVLAMAGAGEVGMAIAILVKTKSARLKKIVKSALPIAFMGIGEPMIYGVSLPLFYPFFTACLGAGFGGAFVAFGIQASGGFGAGALGLSGILLTGVITNGQWLWYLGGLLVSYVMGFVLTYLFGFKEWMVERLG